MSTKKCCPHCGSERILRDAWTKWDGTEWVVHDVLDNCVCNECGADFNDDEIEDQT
jgi:predicted Zn-ribbon and HTH transcriptional regulator